LFLLGFYSPSLGYSETRFEKAKFGCKKIKRRVD